MMMMFSQSTPITSVVFTILILAGTILGSTGQSPARRHQLRSSTNLGTRSGSSSSSLLSSVLQKSSNVEDEEQLRDHDGHQQALVDDSEDGASTLMQNNNHGPITPQFLKLQQQLLIVVY